MISIRSKPASRFQASCSASIHKCRIRLICALRQALSPGRILATTNLLPLILLSFCGHRAPSRQFFFFQNQIKNKVFETLVHLWSALLRAALRAASESPGSLAIPALVALPALALSFAALSIGGVWAMSLDGAPSTPLMFCPAVFFQAGFVESFSHFRLASRGCCFDGTLVALLRPVVHTGASSRCSRPFPGLVVLRTSAPLLALSTGPMMPLLSSER